MKYTLLFVLLFFGYPLFGQFKIGESVIREALLRVAEEHHLSQKDIETYRISDQYVQKRNGSTHVYLLQTINGKDVFNAQIQLHFSKKGKLVFSNSAFVKDKDSKMNAASATIDLESAFMKVLDTLSIPSADKQQLKFESDSAGNLILVKNELFFHPVRVRLGYEEVNDALVLVYQFALEPRSDKRMYVVKIDASTGNVVCIINRTLDCKFEHQGNSDKCMLSVPFPNFSDGESATPKSGASYNAFPLGIESPIHGSRSILTNIENPVASPFGWHDTDGNQGAEYSNTYGNNVFVYEDTLDENAVGYSTDGGSSLHFDFPIDLNASPAHNIDASLTNLFVWNNFMHDVSYHYGFDEESGNFQMNNYGNGGFDTDAVMAEGLDGGGTNNANFGTPEDGYNPRMQMFIWIYGSGELLTVNSPPSVAGVYQTGISTFGLVADFPSVTAEVVLVNSGGANPSQGCSAPLNNLAGKIALIDRGTCVYSSKARYAQDAGAVGVIIINNVAGDLTMAGNDSNYLTIPVISITLEKGNLIKAALLSGPVNAMLGGEADVSYIDGSFDNGVVSHEYGHGISNRLTGGPSQSDCLTNKEQGGEGWSDFFSLVMTTRSTNSAEEARGIGNFANNTAANAGGIRQYPYSRNLSVNPLTYGDVGVIDNSHATGTIWCAMLWDLYWNMVDKYGNTNDLYATNGGNNKAIQLVMEGMRMQVCRPGFVDARDAILAADELLFDGANACLIWKTFARRGLGFGAKQGSKNITGDEIESFTLPALCTGAGIEEVNAFDFDVYPVPARDLLKVSNSNGIEIDALVVFDLSGKEVARKNQVGLETQLDVSRLTGGVYILQIQVGELNFQKRFVII